MAKRPPAAKGGRKGGRASAPPPNLSTGDFPSRETVRAFIKDSPGRVGKREIIRHFRLGPEHRTALRDLLRDLASAGNVAPAGHRRFTAPGRLPDAMIVEIIGTDLSRDAVARAQEGLYTQFEVQRGLPMQMLVKYFTKDAAGWRVKDPIRAMVEFREGNLLGDLRPFGVFDIVFCRNVLIYFDPPTKARVLAAIARQMAPDAALYLGGSETTLGVTNRFIPLNGERGVYGLA